MNSLTKFLLVSLATHLVIVYMVVTFNSSFTHMDKTLVVDFTLLDSKGSKSPGAGKITGQSRQERGKTVGSENKRMFFAHDVQTRKVDSTHLNPVPATATEPARTSRSAAPVSPTAQAMPSQSTVSSAGKSGNEAATGGSASARAGGSGGSWSGHGQAGSGNGTGNSTEQLRKRYLAEQFEYIKKLIEKNIKYPARALRMGWSGRVLVSFTILESGHVANMKILSSSGYDLLDENLLDTIKTVEPFPKPPVSAQLKISFNYKPEQ